MAINWDDMQIAVVDPDTFVITSDEDIYTLDAEQRMISFVGEKGESGEKGDTGEAATIEIASVQTLPPDSRNFVENIGDSHNARLVFGLAQGATGNTGNGIYSVEKTGTVGLVDTYTITFTDGRTFSYEVTNGQQSSVPWGNITGTLSEQTDLQNTLNTKTNLSNVTSEFSATKAYAIDDLVIYQGALYRFTTTHAAGAWNAAHVTACTISEVMSHFAKFRITGTVSSGNMTLTDSRIDSEHWKVPNGGIYFETPRNVTTEVNWSTNITEHTITLSATYTASTSVIVELEWMQN